MGQPVLADCTNCLMFEFSKVGNAPLEYETTSCAHALVHFFNQRAVIDPCGVGRATGFPNSFLEIRLFIAEVPVLSTSDSRSQKELYERQSRTPGRPTSVKNQRIRNVRLSDCQEEAHGRMGSKAGKDAKEGKSPEPYRTSALHASVGYCNPRGRPKESETRHVVFSGTRPITLREGSFPLLKFLPPKCSWANWRSDGICGGFVFTSTHRFPRSVVPS